MKHHDGNVTQKDFENLRAEVSQNGWSRTALAILASEPLLATRIANGWAKIAEMLEELGLNAEQRTRVLAKIGRLVIVSVAVTQRSGRRLWDDLLPSQEGDKSHD